MSKEVQKYPNKKVFYIYLNLNKRHLIHQQLQTNHLYKLSIFLLVHISKILGLRYIVLYPDDEI